MKKIFLLFLFVSSLVWAQMPNISSVWMNNSKAYTGTIDGMVPLKIKVNISEQNRQNDQEYFLAGYTLADNSSYTKFEGKLRISKYRDTRKGGKVWGEYELAEEPGGKHSGLFTGKFVYTFRWNKASEQIENPEIKFSGSWKSYDGTTHYKTQWINNE